MRGGGNGGEGEKEGQREVKGERKEGERRKTVKAVCIIHLLGARKDFKVINVTGHCNSYTEVYKILLLSLLPFY